MLSYHLEGFEKSRHKVVGVSDFQWDYGRKLAEHVDHRQSIWEILVRELATIPGVRLVVPGVQGVSSVKWLRRLKVVEEPVHSREETAKYTDPMPDGKSRQFTFYMESKSIITRPSGGQRIASPGFVEISGIAWSGHGKIARVDVSVDGGKTWSQAALQEPVLSKSLTRFRLPWQWQGQAAVIQSRATDETGYVQPTFPELLAVRGENAFYHNNAVQTWLVQDSGEVKNVQLS